MFTDVKFIDLMLFIGSGGVDEEVFIKAFEDVPKVQVSECYLVMCDKVCFSSLKSITCTGTFIDV